MQTMKDAYYASLRFLRGVRGRNPPNRSAKRSDPPSTSDLEQGVESPDVRYKKPHKAFFRTRHSSVELHSPPPAYRTKPGSEEIGGPLSLHSLTRRQSRSGQPIEQRNRTPLFVYYVSAVQIIVFIATLIENARWSGSPIALRPKFNPLVGPSPTLLISMGARYVPCIRPVELVLSTEPTILWPCPREHPAEGNKCTLEQLCGAEKKPKEQDGEGIPRFVPNQWYRFFTPIFLHSGIIQLLLSMLPQFLIGRNVEKKIGTLRFGLIYLSAGLFGAVAGSSFNDRLAPFMGPTSCLFGTSSVFLMDVISTWKSRQYSLVEVVAYATGVAGLVALAIVAPMDTFAHWAGAAVGFLLGLSLKRSSKPPHPVLDGFPDVGAQNDASKRRRRRNENKRSRWSMVRQWFTGRTLLWWLSATFRLASVSLIIATFIALVHYFYRKKIVYHV